jgi:hypothetical protein
MSVEFPMWKEGHKRLLDSVLARVPRGLSWRLRWFDGVVDPAYETSPPLETHVNIVISESDLRRLAAALGDLNAIALSARATDGLLEVECEDSDRWIVRGSGSLAGVERSFADLQ